MSDSATSNNVGSRIPASRSSIAFFVAIWLKTEQLWMWISKEGLVNITVSLSLVMISLYNSTLRSADKIEINELVNNANEKIVKRYLSHIPFKQSSLWVYLVKLMNPLKSNDSIGCPLRFFKTWTNGTAYVSGSQTGPNNAWMSARRSNKSPNKNCGDVHHTHLKGFIFYNHCFNFRRKIGEKRIYCQLKVCFIFN